MSDTSVGEDFPRQIERVRELLDAYREIPTGGFGAKMIADVLRRAEAAQASGDVVAIVRSYTELKDCE